MTTEDIIPIWKNIKYIKITYGSQRHSAPVQYSLCERFVFHKTEVQY